MDDINLLDIIYNRHELFLKCRSARGSGFLIDGLRLEALVGSDQKLASKAGTHYLSTPCGFFASCRTSTSAASWTLLDRGG